MLHPNNHTLFTAKDFTEDELNRRNILAIAVIEDGVEICKVCNASGEAIKEDHYKGTYYWEIQLPGKIHIVNITGTFSSNTIPESHLPNGPFQRRVKNDN